MVVAILNHRRPYLQLLSFDRTFENFRIVDADVPWLNSRRYPGLVWADGKLVQANIQSLIGGPIKIRDGDSNRVWQVSMAKGENLILPPPDDSKP